MNLSSILVLLQLAITLLVTPNLSPAQQQQAVSFANEAVAIAGEALTQPPSTPLGSIPTSSAPFAQVVSSTPNITITVNPPSQPYVSQPENLGSVPQIEKTEIPWSNVFFYIPFEVGQCKGVTWAPCSDFARFDDLPQSCESYNFINSSTTITVNDETAVADVGVYGLASDTPYDFSIHFEGDTWTSDVTGTFPDVDHPGGVWDIWPDGSMTTSSPDYGGCIGSNN